jgi:NADH dehydrogenase FAD-containing subunit
MDAKRIVIIGTGFAGFWSAFSAQRLINTQNQQDAIHVVVIAPEAKMVIRPRLYEANPDAMGVPLAELFKAGGIEFMQGTVETIDIAQHNLEVFSPPGTKTSMTFDRLILAAGSAVYLPPALSGLEDHAFSIDSQSEAVKLDRHIEQLSTQPDCDARNTIVVCGAGFTGLELAAELPKRLGGILHGPNIILIDSSSTLGATLGPGPRAYIQQAVVKLGIEVKLNAQITSITSKGLTLASGERIVSSTVIWTAGVRATPLTQQISGSRDALSRLHVDEHLRVPGCEHVFATGDAAAALADTTGHYTMMSCQHALVLGRFSGFNAAADLIGQPLKEYSQPKYVTCLDLGSWGAVFTNGWDREVKLTGMMAKKVKKMINQKMIYPPQSAAKALGLAEPSAVEGTSGIFRQLFQL